MMKGLSSETAWGFLTWLLTLGLRMPHICAFHDCFSLNHFFCYFLSLLHGKTEFIKLYTRFWIKKSHFFCLDVLACCSAVTQYSKIACSSSKILKRSVALALRVNETKDTSRNVFIDNGFSLKKRKNQKMTKRPTFRSIRRFLTWLLTLALGMLHICGFQYCFSFNHFFATFCYFSIVRLSSLNCRLNF